MKIAFAWMIAIFGLSTFAGGCGHGHDECLLKNSIVVQSQIQDNEQV